MPTRERLAELRARTDEELLAATPAENRCRTCQQVKPGTEFARDRSKPDGRDTRCKPCTAESMQRYRETNPERVRASKARSHLKNYPTKGRAYRLKSRYGLTSAEYDELLLTQDGKCAICGNPETGLGSGGREAKGLAVDHCHDSGVVRGLLCGRCNVAIGLLNHDPDLLRAAIDYLSRTE